MNASRSPETTQYITIGYLRCLADYLRQQRISLPRVLAMVDLREADLDDLDRRIPDVAEEHLLQVAEEVTGDRNVGLHAGQSMRPTHLGILGHLMMTSRQSRDWFELHMRYEQLVGNGSRAEYELVDGLVRLTLHRRGAVPAYSRQVIEYSLSGWMAVTRLLAGPEFSPARIDFPHPEPAELAEQQALFRCPLHFGCEELRLYFAPQTLALPLQHGDTSLREALEKEASRRLQALRVEQIDRDPEVALVRQFVANNLALGVPGIEAVARAMQTSVRSLQRRLDAQGTHYSQLVEQVRRSLVEQYAQDRSLSLADIALMLGFSDQSTFQRAFRRWFGITPGEYRRG
ncbi:MULTISPECIES: AraC family transcriptional regulator [unclassified Pseudomonas]|uniref:AraC family transcriptional regulator n=1 Tax=unclassified Pseudomonas TaxID=196821 RepID=UPI0007316B38|nr:MULTISPECIES: AraC family transcriptional regulator [unclassified Pseudomonas]KSW25809.1 hypothetical protein AOX63_19250 [Pseudomonas sp. ADP]OBP12326.1 hypothetical protein BAE52_04970 [Pseudomonas sp. EGD-AKN5]QOF82410.1 AraC family transcriptional regulator [Pseudomonas sp. ADPe]